MRRANRESGVEMLKLAIMAGASPELSTRSVVIHIWTTALRKSDNAHSGAQSSRVSPKSADLGQRARFGYDRCCRGDSEYMNRCNVTTAGIRRQHGRPCSIISHLTMVDQVQGYNTVLMLAALASHGSASLSTISSRRLRWGFLGGEARQ